MSEWSTGRRFFDSALSQQQFLTEYWQKKPLLIRQAFQNFISPISADELAGLTLEKDIESRLISYHDEHWQMRHGPLDDADYQQLPDKNWTILVQDVDKHVPDTASILEPFQFIPNWRCDDLMISYATQGGTVGPHTDSYDVFLLQAEGQRHWQVSDSALYDAEVVEVTSGLVQLQHLTGRGWCLEPGDMLYIPPHYGHYGVALSAGMTFSIGFSAPSYRRLLEEVFDNKKLSSSLNRLYSDPQRQVVYSNYEIEAEAINGIQQQLLSLLSQTEGVIVESIGRVVTETKASLITLATDFHLTASITAEEVTDFLRQGGELSKNPYYRFAWLQDRQAQQYYFFMAGQSYPIPLSCDKRWLEKLASASLWCYQDWQEMRQDPDLATLFMTLLNDGGWYYE